MKKLLSRISVFALIFCLGICLVACGKTDGHNSGETSEKITLSKVMLDDVEFENSEETKIKQDGNEFKISGTIDAMSKSQKLKFGDETATHVVAIKLTFDKERTLKEFKLKGNITKVYSTDNTAENYAGSLTDLLDNEDGEDAFCYLVLSAKTEEYKMKATYTDGTESKLELKIVATMATATAEE